MPGWVTGEGPDHCQPRPGSRQHGTAGRAKYVAGGRCPARGRDEGPHHAGHVPPAPSSAPSAASCQQAIPGWQWSGLFPARCALRLGLLKSILWVLSPVVITDLISVS